MRGDSRTANHFRAASPAPWRQALGIDTSIELPGSGPPSTAPRRGPLRTCDGRETWHALECRTNSSRRELTASHVAKQQCRTTTAIDAAMDLGQFQKRIDLIGDLDQVAMFAEISTTARVLRAGMSIPRRTKWDKDSVATGRIRGP